MANTLNENTMVWTVTETGAITTENSHLTNPLIGDLIYVPSAASDDVVLQDGDASEDAVVLKAGASDTSPVHKSFRPQGRRVANLTCSTIDGGTLYVYLM